MTQEVWTVAYWAKAGQPHIDIVGFLRERMLEGWRIVSVTPQWQPRFNGQGVEQFRFVGYIVVGEKS